MKDIDIIIPVHEYNDEIKELLKGAIESVVEAQKYYTEGKLKCLLVYSENIAETGIVNDVDTEFKGKIEVTSIKNDGKTDYCSQINFGVDHVKTDFFSILEFDDAYTPKWFMNANKYFYGNESISVFIPVNLIHETFITEHGENERWQYGNTMAISPMFMTSDENDNDELGIINYIRLEKCALFNITGAIFNTNDFISVGKYKPSIKAAFNYELLLRMTKLGLKAMVVPKEGYIHDMGRKGSLTDVYKNEMTEEELDKWFNLAMRECAYKEDREKDIVNIKEEAVK